MTPDEVIAGLDALSFDAETLLMRTIITHQQRRLAKLQHQRYVEQDEREKGCDHVWEFWDSGLTGTTHHKRCVKCGKQPPEWDSSD